MADDSMILSMAENRMRVLLNQLLGFNQLHDSTTGDELKTAVAIAVSEASVTLIKISFAAFDETNGFAGEKKYLVKNVTGDVVVTEIVANVVIEITGADIAVVAGDPGFMEIELTGADGSDINWNVTIEMISVTNETDL